MKAYSVGLYCYNHKIECDCNDWAKDGYCHSTIVRVEDINDITLEICLRQQSVTEYENAVDIWTDFVVIDEVFLSGGV